MTRIRSLILLIGALVFAGTAAAAPFTHVVAYGDSLSDNGNLFALAGQPGDPYFQGRASNGRVAVELLAERLGAKLEDFAHLGATTGVGNHLDPGGTATTVGLLKLPGMRPPFDATLPGLTPIASSSLFVLWGGANDFLSPSPEDATPFDTANRAVTNLSNMAKDLQNVGAGRVVVLGLPDLGLTPYGRAGGILGAAQATALSDYFNLQLMAALPTGVVFFDTSSLLRNVVNNPGAYGLSNVTDACYDALNPNAICSTPNNYLFFDDFHPTARGHEIVADALFATAVPEPATFAVSGLALGALLTLRRRRAS
jgi:phospholipase/lecithinase/hemolysin